MPNTKPLQSAVVGVGSRVLCVWDWGLQDRNLAFVRATDHEYFTYLARVHAAEEDGPDRLRAALAIRSAYHHGLETFFMLLGAAVQAPHCVPVWMLKTEPGMLRQLVADIQGGKKVRNMLRLTSVSWASIAAALIYWDQRDAAENSRVQARFGELWAGFARDYLEDHHRIEYNTLKHGARSTVSAGVTIKVAEPTADGSRPTNPDQWHGLGNPSPMGTRFVALRQIDGAPPAVDDPHYRLVDQVVNWDPAGLLVGMKLISASLLNVASGIRVRLKDPERESIIFGSLDSETDFARPWADAPGVSTFTTEYRVHEQDITRYSAKELGQRLKTLQGR
jgi:hypothetical protein